jgi:hypothetical protein
MSLRAGRQEQDTINVPQAVVAFISAISMVVLTIIGVYATTHNVNWTEAETSRVKAEPTTPPKFGMLHQTLFEVESDAADVKKEQFGQLNSFGWVDEAKGVAHIPIELAKKRLLEGKGK